MSLSIGTLSGILDLDSKPFDAKLAAASGPAGLGKLGGVAKTVGDHMGIALTGGIVGIGAGLFKLGESFDDQFDKIRVGTGKTGAELEALKGQFDAVVSEVPTSFDGAGTAITVITSKLGLSGDKAKGMSEQFLELSRLTKTDLTGNLQSGTDALNAWNVTAADQPAVLDSLFRASQLTGISFSDLSGDLAGNSTVFRALGFDVGQATTVIAGMRKAGLDVSEVMPAMTKSLASAAKEGKDAGTVYQETIRAIKEAPDAAAAGGIAMQVFGAKAGPKFAALVRDGKFAYDSLGDSIANGTDTIIGAGKQTADFGEKWTMFRNKAMVALLPVATKVFDTMGKGLDFLTKHQPVLIALAAIVGVSVVAAFVAWAASALAASAGTLLAVASVLLLIAPFALVGVAIFELATHWSEVWDWIKSEAAAGKDWIVDKWNAVIGFLTGIPGRISAAVHGMFDGIKDAFRAAINWVIDHWNGLEFTLPSVDTHIPGVGKIGGWTLGTPDIPRLHGGGVVPGSIGTEVPILALAGERVRTAGQEAALQSRLASSNAAGDTSVVIHMPVTLSRKATADDARMLRRAVLEAVNSAGVRGQRIRSRAVA